jgi:hypothetical protein
MGDGGAMPRNQPAAMSYTLRSSDGIAVFSLAWT